MNGLEYGQPAYAKLRVTPEHLTGLLEFLKQKGGKPAAEFEYALHYYPHYLLVLRGEIKRKFFMNKVRHQCMSVDAIKGYVAKTPYFPDEDHFTTGMDERGTILPPLYSVKDAYEAAVENLQQSGSVSFQKIFWSHDKLAIEVCASRLVFKPYWLVRERNRSEEKLYVIDGITGEKGGINGYRFIQGYSLIENGKESGKYDQRYA